MNPLAYDYYNNNNNNDNVNDDNNDNVNDTNDNANDNNDDTSRDTESTASSDTEYSNNSNDDENYNYEYNNTYNIHMSNNFIKKNILLIPEIYNKYFHGKTMDSDPNIDGQFLVLQTFNIQPENSIFEFFKYANDLCKFYKKYYKKNYYNSNVSHNLLRNYNNIIKGPSYLNLQIGQIYYLRGDECVCVIKTIWLKIIQRAWKKIYKIRKEIKQLRCRPDSIMYRQICGKWQQNCNYLPSIRGMLL